MNNLHGNESIKCSNDNVIMKPIEVDFFINPNGDKIITGRTLYCPKCKSRIYAPDPNYLEVSLKDGYLLRQANGGIGRGSICKCDIEDHQNKLLEIVHIDYKTKSCGCRLYFSEKTSLLMRVAMRINLIKTTSIKIIWIPISRLSPA